MTASLATRYVMPCIAPYSGWEIPPLWIPKQIQYWWTCMLKTGKKTCMVSWYHARATLDFIANTLTIHKKIIGPMAHLISAAQGEQHPWQKLMRGAVININLHYKTPCNMHTLHLQDPEEKVGRQNQWLMHTNATWKSDVVGNTTWAWHEQHMVRSKWNNGCWLMMMVGAQVLPRW